MNTKLTLRLDDHLIASAKEYSKVDPVNRLVIENALQAKFTDFEDAVLHESARHAGAEYIITRNIKDFKKAKIPVFTPTELLSMLEALA